MILTTNFYYAANPSQFIKGTFVSWCKGPILNLPRSQSTDYGTNAVHFRCSLVLNNRPANIKSNKSVFEFKHKDKNLKILTVDVKFACRLVSRQYLAFC